MMVLISQIGVMIGLVVFSLMLAWLVVKGVRFFLFILGLLPYD